MKTRSHDVIAEESSDYDSSTDELQDNEALMMEPAQNHNEELELIDEAVAQNDQDDTNEQELLDENLAHDNLDTHILDESRIDLTFLDDEGNDQEIEPTLVDRNYLLNLSNENRDDLEDTNLPLLKDIQDRDCQDEFESQGSIARRPRRNVPKVNYRQSSVKKKDPQEVEDSEEGGSPSKEEDA